MRRSAPVFCSVSATLALLCALAATTLAANASVTIQSSEFTPRAVTVVVGERVTWTNRDPLVHTATGENRAFDTGALQPAQNQSVTFASPGTFPYFCQIHSGMRGTVTVQSLATPVPTTPRPTPPPPSIVPTSSPSPAPTASPSPSRAPSPVPTATPVATAAPIATLAIASPTRSAGPVALSPSVSPEPGPGPAIAAGAAIAIAGLGLTAFVLWRRSA